MVGNSLLLQHMFRVSKTDKFFVGIENLSWNLLRGLKFTLGIFYNAL